MKPPPFDYHDPRTVDDVTTLLAEKENANLLAGGQSLMPMLNMRFVLPDDIIDLNRVEGLSGIRQTDDGISIGAMTRQSELERSELLRCRCPILAEALRQVGHIQTRNRGTIGGSLCHLDPAAELPTLARGLDASICVKSHRGERRISMADFPVFFMTPAIEPDELVTAVEFHPWPQGHGYCFIEFARRHGDFALVGVAVLLEVAGGGAVTRASITLGGVGQAPHRCSEAEAVLIGSEGSEAAFAEAAETCRTLDAMDDAHVSGTYRRHLGASLMRRALHQAYQRATGEAGQ